MLPLDDITQAQAYARGQIEDDVTSYSARLRLERQESG